MGNFPWGPHGPQTGPNQITPNPTAPYVPPPAAPAYFPPTVPMQGPVGYGPPNAPAYYGPTKKHYWIALPLAFILGPIGLFYASKKGALILLIAWFGVPVGLTATGVLSFASPAHPFDILGNHFVMTSMWSLCTCLSLVWSIFGVHRHNASL